MFLKSQIYQNYPILYLENEIFESIKIYCIVSADNIGLGIRCFCLRSDFKIFYFGCDVKTARTTVGGNTLKSCKVHLTQLMT